MRATATIERPAGVHVHFRQMKFDFEESGFHRYWLADSPFKSLFWTQLSTAFAPGEKFFIDSARALRHQLRDPALREELREFCRQEGHRTAQHLKFDRINQDMGIDVPGCRARYMAILDLARAQLEPLGMLAATCALEHFTACFADQFFANEELFRGADPRVRALWAWHAAEEAEHRATCFDLYTQLGGTYGRRVGLLMAAWSMVLGVALYNTALLLHEDDRLWTRDTLQGLRYLLGRRGLLRKLGPSFVDYLRPRFHPWQHHDGSDIERWRADNAQYIQSETSGPGA